MTDWYGEEEKRLARDQQNARLLSAQWMAKIVEENANLDGSARFLCGVKRKLPGVKRRPPVIVLCTHHKGGVGKTELAIQVTGVLRSQLGRTLLIDCDGQASAWKFYFGEDPQESNELRDADERLAVIWNKDRLRIKSLAVVKETYDHFVIDIDTPLENTVQTIVQNDPDLVLIPVNLQHEALTQLKSPLAVIAALEKKASHQPRVRIVPLGAKVAEIRAILDRIPDREKPRDCLIAPRVRNLLRETNLARKERHYIWEHPDCQDLSDYFRSLIGI